MVQKAVSSKNGGRAALLAVVAGIGVASATSGTKHYKAYAV